MKKLIFILAILLIGCTGGNNEATKKWIKSEKHPIRCILSYGYVNGENVYTLISADGKIHNTGMVDFTFPDTLK